MFLPDVHVETDTAEVLQLIRENPLGILITNIKSSQQDSLQCTHVPFVLDLPDESGESAPQGTLRDPKFYVETKPDTAKVVPTWNYAATQIYGKLSLYYDSKTSETGAFLAKQLHDLSENSERSIMGYTGGDSPEPWKVADAPERYIDIMQRNIVGIEIRINKIEGKFKMSQEKRGGDLEGVIKGFANLGSETGDAISALVKERADLYELKKQEIKN
ncbi:putative FMN-binding domain-containing protein [Lipomyces kononenkoae]|uniref:FMN-binding domain-containing protein n=1 Tax=Lipomyces kononenkoae TaxID=34357 RepID=A0ACC3SRF6_LIPKO